MSISPLGKSPPDLVVVAWVLDHRIDDVTEVDAAELLAAELLEELQAAGYKIIRQNDVFP